MIFNNFKRRFFNVSESREISVSLFFILFFVLLIIIIFGIYDSVSDSGLGSSAAAGWIQSVGAIAAIAAAFVVSNEQSKAAIQAALEDRRASKLAKMNGVRAVVLAARNFSSDIDNALDDMQPLSLLEVYDRSVVTGLCAALSEVPLYDLGSPVVVTKILSLSRQLVYLGNQVDAYIDGPYKLPDMVEIFNKYSYEFYPKERASIYEGCNRNLMRNVKQRINFIIGVCDDIEREIDVSNN